MHNSIPFSPSRLDSSPFLKSMIKSYIKNGSDLIDIGCGRLYFLYLLSEVSWKGNYLGIDFNPPKSIPSFEGLKAKVIKGDFLKSKLDQKFNCAICLWVLKHIRDDNYTLKNIQNA